MENNEKIFVYLFVILVTVLLGIIITNIMFKRKTDDEKEIVNIKSDARVSISSVMEAMNKAQELVLYKYFTADYDVYTKDSKFFNTGIKIPFSTDETVFAYRGEVGVGIRNLSEISIDINEENKTITISLPKLEILYNSIDHSTFKTYEVKTSLFRNTTLEDYNDLEIALLDKQEENINNYKDFWKEAEHQTVNVLSTLISTIKYSEDYKLRFINFKGNEIKDIS